MDYSDITKVESLDYNTISNQLQYIFKTDDDIVNFVNFLQNIKKFINLSNDKRHMTLLDLCYFKSQIQLYEKKVNGLLLSKKNQQMKDAIKKAKGKGEKITESIISYYEDIDDSIAGLEDILSIVSAWAAYMQDLYYICNQLNKNLGNF